MEVSNADVRRGMILGGGRELHRLVTDYILRRPMQDCWAPHRFAVRVLETGRAESLALPLGGTTEVAALPTRVLEMVCFQGDELVVLAPESGEVFELAAESVCDDVGRPEPGTRVLATLFAGQPVWVASVVGSAHGRDF